MFRMPKKKKMKQKSNQKPSFILCTIRSNISPYAIRHSFWIDSNEEIRKEDSWRSDFYLVVKNEFCV